MEYMYACVTVCIATALDNNPTYELLFIVISIE